MDHLTFSDLEYLGKKRKTRRELFLVRMDALIPYLNGCTRMVTLVLGGMAVLLSVGLLDNAHAQPTPEYAAHGEPSRLPIPCENGVVIPGHADNPELLGDCEILWRVRSVLGGGSTLDWSGEQPLHDWEGVGVTHQGGRLRVNELNLSFNKLTGRIPPELGNLSELDYLRLSYNELRGNIPPELGNLSELSFFSLSNNQLTGSIPVEFGNLTNLRALNLSDNRLIGRIPSELCNLTLLKWVRVSGKEMSVGFPSPCRNITSPLIAGPHSITIPENRSDHMGKFTAVDEQGHDVTWSVSDQGRGDADWFSIDSEGALRFKIPPSYANPADENRDNVYRILIVASDDGTPRLSAGWGLRVRVTPTGGQTVVADDDGGGMVDEGEVLLIDALTLLENDTSAENDTLSVTGVVHVSNGAVSLDGTTITYQHDGSETNNGSFTYIASDGKANAAAVVWISVNPVNDPPVAANDTTKVNEGGTLNIDASTLLDDDTDAENDVLSIATVGDASNGTVSLDGRTIVYRHDGSETTTGSFTYIATDGQANDTAVVRVSVNPVNDPPVASDDKANVNEGETLNVDASTLLDDDTDAENDVLSISTVGDASNGTVSLDGITIVYRHDGSETTTGSFIYIATDGQANDTAVVRVSVNPVNDSPAAADDTTKVNEGETLNIDASTLLDNDADAENDLLSIATVGDASNGTVSMDGRTIVYRHDGSETTTGSFTYIATDGQANDTAAVRVSVNPVNDPPVASDDTANVNESETLNIDASTLLDNDADAENDLLSIATVGDASNGTVSMDGRTIVYRHDGSETTTGSFTYIATDGQANDTAVVRVSVNPVNDPPVAADDTTNVNEGETLNIDASTLLDNDTDAENDLLSINSVGDASNGTVSLDGRTITYQHDGSETTTGSFTYIATDGQANDTAVVRVSVNPVNDPPVAADDTTNVNEGETLNIDASTLLDNDTDAEQDPLSIKSVGDASNGTVSLDGRTITYQHDGSETTTGSFTYIATDGQANDTAVVRVSVNPVNDFSHWLLISLVLGAGLLVVTSFIVIRVRRPRRDS